MFAMPQSTFNQYVSRFFAAPSGASKGEESIMKTSVIAASILLIGATAMAAPATQTKKASAAKPAATAKMTMSHASGVVEKYDAATKTLTIKHDGKEQTFTVADTASVMKGKEKADLATATGMEAKIEYMTSGTTKTADKIELSAAKTAAARANGKLGGRPKKGHI